MVYACCFTDGGGIELRIELGGGQRGGRVFADFLCCAGGDEADGGELVGWVFVEVVGLVLGIAVGEIVRVQRRGGG